MKSFRVNKRGIGTLACAALTLSGCNGLSVGVGNGAAVSSAIRGQSNSGSASAKAGPIVHISDSAPVSYQGPLIIRTGGTYSGNYESTDPGTPAIDVWTSDPVIIENCNVRGQGDLIHSWAQHLNLTVRNCNGYGVKASGEQGRFINLANPGRVLVHNNYFENVAKGVSIYIDPTYARTNRVDSVRVFGNIGRNMNDNSQEFGTFVQFNRVLHITDAIIGYNQFINEPGKNMSSDNINLFNSSGTASAPIQIVGNFLQGAYPKNPTDSDYTGSGITSDGWGDANVSWDELIVSYIDASQNTILSTGNAAMNIAGGHDIRYHHNRIATSGLLPDGSGKLASSYAGASAFNYFNHPASLFHDTTLDNNVIGFVTKGTSQASHQPNETPEQYGSVRQDLWQDCGSNCHDNSALPSPITLDTERDEWRKWNANLVNQFALGSLPAEIRAYGRIGSTVNGNDGLNRYGKGVSPFAFFEVPVATPPPVVNPPVAGSTMSYVSDLPFRSMSNGWGDVERDRSNGEQAANDGHTLTLNGVTYPKGLGGHAPSDVRIELGANCSLFEAKVGIDDEISANGNVTFRVLGDGVELYHSPAVTPTAATVAVSVNISGVRELALVLDNNGDSNSDHGDWADAKVTCGSNPTPTPTPTAVTPTPTPSATPPPETASCVGMGSITMERWDGVAGVSVSQIPVSTTPTLRHSIPSLSIPVNVADNYGTRVRGYLCVPTSGDYQFAVAGDDNAQLSLSTDDSGANLRKIAEVSPSTGWTNPGEYTKDAAQTSGVIHLVAGKRYYLEALQKEGGGGDHLSVEMKAVGGAWEAPIAGTHLAPVGDADIGPTVACSGTGSISMEKWNGVGGSLVSDIPVSRAADEKTNLPSFSIPRNAGDNYGTRVRGYVCVDTTGDYGFDLAADDNAKLFLSTSADAANKQLIAEVTPATGWTYEDQYDKDSSHQQSGKIHLVAGTRYYIEGLQKEQGGGDHMTVRLRLPNGSIETPIAGSRLVPIF